jgi:hypothetical protein
MKFEQIDIKEPKDLFDLIGKRESEKKWIYRGQGESSWGLKTSIDRMFEDRSSIGSSKLETEIALLKRFQRESHHYGINNIDLLNIPEWFSLMQHYGAPTRLLDWTHSPWVGLFFAIAELGDGKKAALWLADWKAIDQKNNSEVKNIYKHDYNLLSVENFTKVIESGDGVIKLNSFRQNQRQIIQQGTFLFPLNVEKTFEENMGSTLTSSELIQLILPHHIKHDLMRALYRMNISYTTLYPGIEGFGRSLKHLYHIEGIMNLEDDIKDYLGYKKKFELN